MAWTNTGPAVGEEGNAASVGPTRPDSSLASSLTHLTALATIATSLVLIGVLTQADVHRDWLQVLDWIHEHGPQLRSAVFTCVVLYALAFTEPGAMPPYMRDFTKLGAGVTALLLAGMGLYSLLSDAILSAMVFVVLLLGVPGIAYRPAQMHALLMAPRIVTTMANYLITLLIPVGAYYLASRGEPWWFIFVPIVGSGAFFLAVMIMWRLVMKLAG